MYTGIQTVCCLNLQFENSFEFWGKSDGIQKTVDKTIHLNIFILKCELCFRKIIYLCLKVYGWKIS